MLPLPILYLGKSYFIALLTKNILAYFYGVLCTGRELFVQGERALSCCNHLFPFNGFLKRGLTMAGYKPKHVA